MPRYKVTKPITHNGRYYEFGEIVDGGERSEAVAMAHLHGWEPAAAKPARKPAKK